MIKIITSIVDRLESLGESISFAESCTGGRVAAAFTALAGVSSVFHGSCVTYSNDIKHLWLGVDSDVLERYGAVSSECVEQMLEGIARKASSEHAIAVSGVAGPTGGTPQKPVGTVYIGVKIYDQIVVERCSFSGDREQIQRASTEYAIALFERILYRN